MKIKREKRDKRNFQFTEKKGSNEIYERKKTHCRLFAVSRCSRCQAGISASELVMRARDLVYHVACFTCASCGTPLNKGDHFGQKDGLVYCRWEQKNRYIQTYHLLFPIYSSVWYLQTRFPNEDIYLYTHIHVKSQHFPYLKILFKRQKIILLENFFRNKCYSFFFLQ